MKKFYLLTALIPLLFLLGCGKTYDLKIDSEKLSWSPALNVEMQVIDADAVNGDMMFQEVGEKKGENSVLDTLIITSDSNTPSSARVGLSAYVQESINSLKLYGYALKNEKSQKLNITTDGVTYPAMLKTFDIQDNDEKKSVAQLYIDKQDDTILLLSYASKKSSNTKAFTNALSSIEIH